MLGIVVVNYASHEELSRHLAKMELPEDSFVVVVDNYSSTEESVCCSVLCGENGWILLQLPENVGFGRACNRGADLAMDRGARELLFLNPDASVGSDSLSLLRESARSGDCIVSPHILDASGSSWFEGGIFDRRRGFVAHSQTLLGSPDWLTGACFIVSQRAWVALGGFDESFFLYWEDVDLTFRWARMGGTIRVDPLATAIHEVGGSQTVKRSRKSTVYVFFNCLNRGRLLSRMGSLSDRLRWLFYSPWYAAIILKRCGRGLLSENIFRFLWAATSGSCRACGLLFISLFRAPLKCS